MTKKKERPSSEAFDRFKVLTQAVSLVPKEEVDKRAAADRRKKKKARKRNKHSRST